MIRAAAPISGIEKRAAPRTGRARPSFSPLGGSRKPQTRRRSPSYERAPPLPVPMSGRGGSRALAQRRERCRHDQHVLLLDHRAGLSALWRPDAVQPRLFADLEPLLGVLIGPDMAPEVQIAELGMPGEGQWRARDSLADCARPTLDLPGDRAGSQRVHADLVDAAELARFELRRERRRDENLAGLVDDEFAHVRRPPVELRRLGT